MALMLLCACAAPRAAENPNAVPLIQQDIFAQRQLPSTIFLSGQPPQSGELANFVVTPDDRVICTFQTAPDPTRSGMTSRVMGHRIEVVGAFGALRQILGAQGRAPQSNVEQNFAVWNGGVNSVIHAGDPRLPGLLAYFRANPTPCWRFS